MTHKERIETLEGEVAELRRQVTLLAIALATRPVTYTIPMGPQPPVQPSPFPQPWTPPMYPFASPNICRSSGGAEGLIAINASAI